MHYPSVATLLGSVYLLTAINLAQADDRASIPLDDHAQEVATRLEGVMDTSAQAATNGKSAVTMTTCRVRLIGTVPESATSTIFLYQEQALSQDLSKPYRQRFLTISASPYSQSVRSRSYRPTNSAAWVNFCNKPLGDRTIQPRDLGNTVCNVFLKPSGNDYVGSTPADGCPTNVRGAVRITNSIVLHKAGMDTWDRGFDATGKQVWGAKAESYQFRKQG